MFTALVKVARQTRVLDAPLYVALAMVRNATPFALSVAAMLGVAGIVPLSTLQ
jgi:hypothetical protein